VETGRILEARYEILGKIAEGASSAVWEARDGETGETVAIKAVSMEEAGWRAEVRDRFQQEARLLTLVRHRHVVGVRAHGETDDGYLYLVLDRLSGETLADRLARPPRLSWREAAAIAVELGRGLGALHTRGVVHRDLKPANVILHDESGLAVAKIVDLGVSKVGAAAADPVLFATLTATGQVLGTPEYMSYEQALGERDVDARADVWALGVVLYEMLAGRRPFTGANVNAVLAAIRRGAPPPLGTGQRGTPEPLARVVARCLTSSRDARYPDGDALAAAITHAVREAEARETGAERARLVGWALAVAAAVAVAAAAAALLPARAPPSVVARPTVAPAVVATVRELEEPGSSVTIAVAAERASAMPPGTKGDTPTPPAPSASAGRAARAVTRVNSAGF
jgi:serine/threonine-protein kinase